MPIQRSAGAEIKLLIEAIGGSEETGREAAVARLAIIGPRAVAPLLRQFLGAGPDTASPWTSREVQRS